jgi:hypothetical protein
MQITAKNDAIKIDSSANTDDATNIIHSIGRESLTYRQLYIRRDILPRLSEDPPVSTNKKS